MRYLYAVLVAFVFVSCSKDELDDMPRDGVFTSGDNTIDIISQDSLVWKISYYRDEPQEYMVEYSQNGDEINFQVKDTIRIDYSDSIFGNSFVVNYYHNSFRGRFNGPNTIEGDSQHSHYEMIEDKYISSSRGADLYVSYRR